MHQFLVPPAAVLALTALTTLVQAQPEIDRAILGQWDCTSEGSIGPDRNVIEFRTDGTYLQKAMWVYDLEQGLLRTALDTHGTWTLEGTVLTDTTIHAELKYAELDGGPLTVDSFDYLRETFAADYAGAVAQADILDVTATTLDLRFQDSRYPWACVRQGASVSS